MEVGELAVALGCGRPIRSGVEVELPRLRRAMRRLPVRASPRLLVGHLAHFLPVTSIIVLRCHPIELARRLGRSHRGTARERRENVAAEATDVVLWEALGTGLPVFEVDTTGRSVAAVAREVAARLRRPRGSRFGTVRWLADPRVTEYLLRPRR